MTAIALSSPPRYSTPRQTNTNHTNHPHKQKLSVNTTPPPSLYATGTGSSSGSYSSTLTPPFAFAIGGPGSPNNKRHMVNLKSNTNLRSKNKQYAYHRSITVWIGMLLVMGVVNVFYQWYAKDEGASDLWSITGIPQGFVGSVVNRQPHLEYSASVSLMEQLEATHTGKAAFLFPKPSSPDTTAVFYHVFLPPGEEPRENSRRIITEQLQQLASSNNPNYILYYNTIGEMTVELNATHIQKLCQDRAITCHHMQHYQEGMEDKTLQRLHDFCSADNDSQDDHAVVYLHNKGSFSKKALNEAWRYQMTQSVVSPDCQKHTTNEPGQCNLCGLYFTAERGLFMAGNMWRSKCSYVKHLIPPSHFQDAMHVITSQAMLERLRNRFSMTLQELRSGVFGIDRFATEFWIASHPDVKPCDFSKAIQAPQMYDMTEIFLRWLRQKVADDDYHSTLLSEWFAESAPYHPLPLTSDLEVAQFQDVRLREYFLMAGNLFRWYGLYGQAPPPQTSWVYTWYPDGEQWKAAVQEHAQNSVTVVTELAAQMEVATGRNKYTRDMTGQKVKTPGDYRAQSKKRQRALAAAKNKNGAKRQATTKQS